MSAGGQPPVRASANGSGPDPAEGSKGDATVADSTQVDSPEAEATGVVEDVPTRDALVEASDNGQVAATADEQGDDEQGDVEQPADTADVEQPAEDTDVEQPADVADAAQLDESAEADHEDHPSIADVDGEPSTNEPVAEAADDEPVASDDAQSAEQQIEDSSPDPIDVANRFAEAAPEPASLFVRPGKAPPASALVPEQVIADLPVLAPVDEVTMPEMASMVPEPDLHLRPAFQQHQYDTVSAFRGDRAAGGTVPISPSWPETQPATEPIAPISEDSTSSVTPAFSDTGSAGAAHASVAPATPAPVPVPPTPTEVLTNRGGTVTPLSPAPTRPPLESPPGPRPSGPAPQTRATPAGAPAPARPTQPRRRPRRARLRLSRVDPWSVAKIALLFSVAMAITTLITVSLLWGVLNLMGVFSDVGLTVTEVTGSKNGGGLNVETLLSLSRVLKFTTIIVILQAVVLTCLATLAAFLYNASSGLVGGVEITLSEAE